MAKSHIEIDKKELIKELNLLVGKKVSDVWRGYGTYVSLEIGKLHEKIINPSKEEKASMEGEWTIAFDGNWKIVREYKEVASSSSNDLKRLDGKIELLKNRIIRSVNISENNKSTFIFFDDNLTATVSSSKIGLISVKNYAQKKWFIVEAEGKIIAEQN